MITPSQGSINEVVHAKIECVIRPNVVIVAWGERENGCRCYWVGRHAAWPIILNAMERSTWQVVPPVNSSTGILFALIREILPYAATRKVHRESRGKGRNESNSRRGIAMVRKRRRRKGVLTVKTRKRPPNQLLHDVLHSNRQSIPTKRSSPLWFLIVSCRGMWRTKCDHHNVASCHTPAQSNFTGKGDTSESHR
jgi:hypothetical protein